MQPAAASLTLVLAQTDADAQRLRKWLLEQAPVEVAPRKVQLASDRS